MKRLLALPFLIIGGLAYGGQGLSGSLTVSSGTFKAIQGFNNNSGGFVQAIAVADSSYTITAPVDAITGLEVQLATGTAVFGSIANTTFGASQGTAGTSGWKVDLSTGVQINGTVTAGQGTAGTSAWKIDLSTGAQVNGTVTSNQGTAGTSAWKVDLSTGALVKQSGVWQVEPGTNTFPVSIVAGAAAGGTSSNFGATIPTAGTAAGFVAAGNNMGMARVDTSSNVFVTLVQPTVIGATVTYNGTQVVGIVQPTVLGATVTYNGTQTVVSNQGTPSTGGWKVDFSTGVQVLQGAAGTSGWKVDSSTGIQVTQGAPGTGRWGVDLASTQVVGSLADNGAAAATNRTAVLPTIYQTSYLNGTAATQGRNGAMSQGTDGLLWTAQLPALRPTSYTASTNTLAVATTATDIAALCGNASNTVLVYGIRASCTQTTAGITPITIVKRSTGYVGTFSTVTAVAQDSNYAGAVSTAAIFTANPTVGTIVGYLDDYSLGCMAPGTATPNDIYVSPSDWKMKPIVLRGTTQCVAIHLNGKTLTGGSFNTQFSWMETATITP